MGEVGEENMEQLFALASRGDSIFQGAFEFDRWREFGVLLGEKVVFNNRKYSQGLGTKEYFIGKIEGEEGEISEDWRSGSSLMPRIIVRRNESPNQAPRVDLVVSFKEPLPWMDEKILAERWAIIDHLLESEGFDRPHNELTEYVVAHTEEEAIVECGKARIRIVPHLAYRPEASLLVEDMAHGVGMELKQVIRSSEELNRMLRAAGVPVTRAATEQLFTMTKDNAPMDRVDLKSLLSHHVPMEIVRCREVEHDDGDMTYKSSTYMAFVSPYGDLYLTLSSDQSRSSRLVEVFCSWDQRTLKFPKNKWASFAALFGDSEGSGAL